MHPDCPFCLSNNKLKDTPLFENMSFFVVGHITPGRDHAVMIVPKVHVVTPFELSSDDWANFPDVLAFAKTALSQWNPDGYTVGWNVGSVAGQTVDHAHMHVICRFASETSVGHGLNGLIKHANTTPITT